MGVSAAVGKVSPSLLGRCQLVLARKTDGSLALAEAIALRSDSPHCA